VKYRKKPVVIDAEQFHEKDKWPAGVVREPGDDRLPYIETLEGRLYVNEGDWIITGVKGEKYPCKPDIFERTYDPVEEAG
jgi:hypothetical protein